MLPWSSVPSRRTRDRHDTEHDNGHDNGPASTRRTRCGVLAEDRGFEPLRAINPTRFPTQGSGVSGCSHATAEREIDVLEHPWTALNVNK